MDKENEKCLKVKKISVKFQVLKNYYYYNADNCFISYSYIFLFGSLKYVGNTPDALLRILVGEAPSEAAMGSDQSFEFDFRSPIIKKEKYKSIVRF